MHNVEFCEYGPGSSSARDAQVLPDALFDVDQKAIFVGHTGSLRYNLFEGKFSVDDTYIVSPFKDTFYIAESIPGQVAAAVIKVGTPLITT